MQLAKIKTGRNKLLLGVIALCFLAAVLLGLEATGAINLSGNNPAATSQTQPSKRQDVNLSPPTEEEKQAGDEIKEQLVQEEASQKPTNANGKKAVIPTITYAGRYGDQIEVSAYVSGIFEEDGSCTLSLTKGSTEHTVTVSATTGANNVVCPAMSIARSTLSETGTWKAKVNYSSAAAAGESQTRDVEVN